MNTDETTTKEVCVDFTWRVHPFMDSAKTSTLVIGLIVFICSIVYISFNSVSWVVLSFIFLFVSLSPFFFPTVFTLNDREIKVKRVFTTVIRPWERFKGFYYDKNGVQLTPFTYPSRLDSYRGLFLKFNNNKEKVIDFIKIHLSPVLEEKRENPNKADE
jgi:hypothetical protein